MKSIDIRNSVPWKVLTEAMNHKEILERAERIRQDESKTPDAYYLSTREVESGLDIQAMMREWHVCVALQQSRNETDQKKGTKRISKMFDKIERAKAYAFVYNWRKAKAIYDIHPDLLEEICKHVESSKAELKLTRDMLEIPYWGIYVRLPTTRTIYDRMTKEQVHIDGFFIMKEYLPTISQKGSDTEMYQTLREHRKQSEHIEWLSMLPMKADGSQALTRDSVIYCPLPNGMESLESLLRDPDCLEYVQRTIEIDRVDRAVKAHPNAKAGTQIAVDMTLTDTERQTINEETTQRSYWIKVIINILMYINTVNTEIHLDSENHYKPLRKGGKAKDSPSSVAVFNVGHDVGVRIRKMRNAVKYLNRTGTGKRTGHHKSPIMHIRCGHNAIYHVGKGRTDIRIKWIMPILVNAKGKGIDYTTLIEVNKKNDEGTKPDFAKIAWGCDYAE